MSIESVFRSAAGADFASSGGGGLSSAEFLSALKQGAGADGAFNLAELSKTGLLDLGKKDAGSVLEAFGRDGKLSVDKLRDLLNGAAGADKAFNLDELKGGLEKLVDRADKKNAAPEGDGPAAEFGRDAGADKKIDEDEFKAMAKKAALEGEDAGKAFDKIAGADGKIDKDEFKQAFGDDKASKKDLREGVDEALGEEKPFAKFGRDAGADGEMDRSEFKALAKKAGVEGEDADKAFDKIAGADGKISKSEWTAEGGMAAGEASKAGFKSAVEDLAGGSGGGGSSPAGAEGPSKGGSGGSDKAKSSGDWSHEVKDGKATINLGDKYTITASEQDATWTVKNNETGHETRISGDPHVDVGNDGTNDFDFKDDMTFKLDDGTKITVGTTPAGNGTTFSSELTITNGADAIKVTGLAGNDGELKVTQSTSGVAMDRRVGDGSVTIDEAGSGWTNPNGDVVDQQVISAAEAEA